MVRDSSNVRTNLKKFRPQSDKLAEFINRKKVDNKKYLHPEIERRVDLIQSRRQLVDTYSSDDDDILPRESREHVMRERAASFSEHSLTDASTKFSIHLTGTPCAQDYYPSFLLQEEGRYELANPPKRYPRENRDEQQYYTAPLKHRIPTPPRRLETITPKQLRQSIRFGRARMQTTKRDDRLSARVDRLPKHARSLSLKSKTHNSRSLSVPRRVAM